MVGLKNVRNRRTDALTQVGWDQLETMLAVYYRGQGYRVDHVGTGATGARFDGGIDLKLFRDDAYIVVQCKHWNAKQVTHNAVHELLGVMVTQGATGAILATSGEFSRYAIEAATKQGHVQLVDGDDLRMMLGSLPERGSGEAWANAGTHAATDVVDSNKADRIAAAADERLRRRGPVARREHGTFGSAMDAGLGLVLLKLLVGLFIVLILTSGLKSVLRPFQKALGGDAAKAQPRNVLPVPQQTPGTAVLQSMRPASGTTEVDHQPDMPEYHTPSEAEIRDSKRKADEAIRILEANTPEM